MCIIRKKYDCLIKFSLVRKGYPYGLLLFLENMQKKCIKLMFGIVQK